MLSHILDHTCDLNIIGKYTVLSISDCSPAILLAALTANDPAAILAASLAAAATAQIAQMAAMKAHSSAARPDTAAGAASIPHHRGAQRIQTDSVARDAAADMLRHAGLRQREPEEACPLRGRRLVRIILPHSRQAS